MNFDMLVLTHVLLTCMSFSFDFLCIVQVTAAASYSLESLEDPQLLIAFDVAVESIGVSLLSYRTAWGTNNCVWIFGMLL